MDCKKIEELLSLYVENELSPGEKRKVKAHLKECPDCSALLSFMKETRESLAGLPELEVSKKLLQRLYVIPERKQKLRKRFDFLLRPALQPVFAVASVFLILASFYFFHPDRDYINKSIDRQVHLGYSNIQSLFVHAGSLKDELSASTSSFIKSFEKLNPWRKPKE